MDATIINIALAFVEGFGLILSPCILPILPIVLSASITGNKARPVGIIVGFVVAFTVLTFSIRAIVQFTHLNPNDIRYFAFAILFLLGIVMMSNYLTEKFASATQRLANIGNNFPGMQQQSGLWGGLLLGLFIGIIWTPCAGPIIAAVIVQVAIQNTNLNSILTVFAFAIGAGAPMLLIALLGREIIGGFSFFRAHALAIRKLLGLIIIISVGYLFYTTETAFSLGNRSVSSRASFSNALINGVTFPYVAPAIAGIQTWVNSPPLSITQLHGKVVLIDFWTYSCINCVRTLPYLKSWYEHYHHAGLEIIGVHSPEFAFEHDPTNVENAVKKYGILYPVALDNQFVTWRNYENSYWPAQYLIDKQGHVVYQHVGEGDDYVIENNIRVLLGMSAGAPTTKALPESAPSSFLQTPETYLGYVRADGFASQENMMSNKPMLYTYPTTLAINRWALQGAWLVEADKVIAITAGSAVKLHFNARKVFAVMGNVKEPVIVKIKLNGAGIFDQQGQDVHNGEVIVDRDRLYSLVNLSGANDGTLEMIAVTPGLKIYTFTFGN